DGLQVDPPTGVLSGTPTQAGAFSFGLQESDSAGDTVPATFDVSVTTDACPDDPAKTDPAACGCGVPQDDADGDGSPDCVYACPFDPLKSAAGLCGCDVPEGSCTDFCPDDPAKIDPGICGCGVPDADTDADGIFDCFESAPADLG